MTQEEIKKLEDSRGVVTDDYTKAPGRWLGPDCSKNLREWKAAQAAARASTPPAPPDPPDALPWDPLQLRQMLLAANQRIAALEAQLNAAVPPHQRGAEKRKV